MKEVLIDELFEKQANLEWFVGCPKEEAQYVVKQPTPECGDDIYARDLTEAEKTAQTTQNYLRRAE